MSKSANEGRHLVEMAGKGKENTRWKLGKDQRPRSQNSKDSCKVTSKGISLNHPPYHAKAVQHIPSKRQEMDLFPRFNLKFIASFRAVHHQRVANSHKTLEIWKDDACNGWVVVVFIWKLRLRQQNGVQHVKRPIKVCITLEALKSLSMLESHQPEVFSLGLSLSFDRTVVSLPFVWAKWRIGEKEKSRQLHKPSFDTQNGPILSTGKGGARRVFPKQKLRKTTIMKKDAAEEQFLVSQNQRLYFNFLTTCFSRHKFLTNVSCISTGVAGMSVQLLRKCKSGFKKCKAQL